MAPLHRAPKGHCPQHFHQVTAPRDAVEGKGPQRPPQKRSDRRLEEVAKAVGGGYCRLQMPLKPALAVRETVAGHRLQGGGGGGSQERQPGQGTRMEGMGETTKGMAGPASPAATGCQGNPCSTGIR